MPERACTVLSDEDGETGFMLDEGAPTTAEERLRAFVATAEREWGLTYDPAKLGQSDEPRPYVLDDDADFARPARDGEEPNAGCWWVFTDLYEAELPAPSKGTRS